MALKDVLRVFVVDDESIIAVTLSVILNQSGFAAESFTDPLKALEKVSISFPDLVISDVMMPGMSGLELAMKIKAVCPRCKIMLFSGKAATSDLLGEVRRKGHDFDILLKPVYPTDLLRAVHAS